MKPKKFRVIFLIDVILTVWLVFTIVKFGMALAEDDPKPEWIIGECVTNTPTPNNTPTPSPTPIFSVMEPVGCTVIFVPTSTPSPSPTNTPTPTKSITSTPKPVKSTSSETDILLRCVQAEAQDQDYKGRMLVARVILNRVESSEWPNDIRGVVYQKGQFAVVTNGSINKVVPDDLTKKAVEEVLNGWDESKGALYFRTITKNRNEWHYKSLTFLFDWDGHSFFK